MDAAPHHDQSFEAWYRAAWTPLVRGLVAYSGDLDLATDAAAEACAHALARWGDVQHMTSPLGWAFTVGRSHIGRARRRARLASLVRQHPARIAHDDAADDVVERLRVVSALQGLPPRQREAVILCYLLEQTQEEAARVMGISRGGLAATIHDARRNWPLEQSPEEVR